MVGSTALARLSGCAALGIALAIAPVAGLGAERLRVEGQCRNGVANGNWALKSDSGHLRASGALAHGMLTGTFIFWSEMGARLAVVPYDGDAVTGTVAFWYPSADGMSERGRRLESPYAGTKRHGVARSWWPDGKARSEVRYQEGEVVEAHAWNLRGQALDTARAARLAAQDALTDSRQLARLETMVRAHLPSCGSATPDAAVDQRGSSAHD